MRTSAFAGETPAQIARHREIEFSHARRYRKGQRPSPTVLRLADLELLYFFAFGLILPDDATGRDRATIALHHLAHLPGAEPRMTGYLARWCPWMAAGEAAALIAKVRAHPLRWTADRLAWRLALTMEVRMRLGITTIGATDCNKAQRETRRRERDKERARARCGASTGCPRQERGG